MKETVMVMTKYQAPDAGDSKVPGGYGAPTPHAAAVNQTPYQAPSGNGGGTAGAGASAHEGFDAMEKGLPMPTKTPMEMSEAPELNDVG